MMRARLGFYKEVIRSDIFSCHYGAAQYQPTELQIILEMVFKLLLTAIKNIFAVCCCLTTERLLVESDKLSF